jgi:hypothetical protein
LLQVAATNARQMASGGAPNVTVDASGRPTGTFVTAAGGPQHIRVATTGNPQQFLTAAGQNVMTVRTPGVLAAHQPTQQQVVTSQQGVSKLQVVGPSTTAPGASQPTERS